MSTGEETPRKRIGAPPGPRKTTEQWIREATTVHGTRYDYSGAVYAGVNALVEIGCAEHGTFRQRAGHHLAGQGCQACGRRSRAQRITLSRDGFIARSEARHGVGRYDYSLVDYTGTLATVRIICPAHGEFEQTPNAHLYAGAGCQKCGRLARSTKTRLTQVEFEAAVRRVHGDRYGLDKAVYNGQAHGATVVVTCGQHGDFEVQANSLLSGTGCRKCHFESKSLTKNALLERVAGWYDPPYDYSAVPDGFVPTRSRVRLVCPAHGGFEIIVSTHLRGGGCRICAGRYPSKAEVEIKRLLTESDVPFVAEWWHPTLRRGAPLRFDFMLPTLGVLLEYDGLHHFRPVRWPGMTEADAAAMFKDTQARDAMKTAWANDNGWRLVRLSDPRQVERDLRLTGLLPTPRLVA